MVSLAKKFSISTVAVSRSAKRGVEIAKKEEYKLNQVKK
jgi:hypothetical protein